MAVEKRTPKQWAEYLAAEREPVTLTEYMAGCLARMLSCEIELVQALRHLESMYGSLDDALAARDDVYRAIATARGRSDRRRLETGEATTDG